MILTARVVVTMDGPPLEGGAVVVDGNRITQVGPASKLLKESHGPVVDLGEMTLLPGLINAHCHLDYSMMRHALDRPKNFTAWVQRLNALKRSLDIDDYLEAVADGFAELKRWGTTSVCNIEAFPELMTRLPPSPLRTWWFYEMIDVRHRVTTEDVVAGALAFFQRRGRALENFGLSPHAPYTASVMLYQLANTCAAAFAMPLTTHVAESSDERAMFQDRSGPLFEFMDSLKRPMTDCGGQSSFSHLWKLGAVNSDWLLVHMNELTEEDFEVLAQQPRGAGPHIVHCPESHRYFSHTPFQFRRLHQMGVNLCVGTDSLASAEQLSLLRELRELWRREPWLLPEQLLRTITVNPARALQRPRELGRISPGALADLIALPVSGSVASVYEKIVAFAQPVPWMMLDGKILS